MKAVNKMVSQNVGPLVSIIMPLYNAEKYLSSAIESILHQTYFNFELIIIDDGSSDGSAEICKEYVPKDSRVRYYFEENSGICAARNLGLSYVNGEYIAFCDDDDEYDKDLLKDNIECLIKSGADLVKFGRRILHAGDSKDGWEETFQIPEGEYTKEEIEKNFAELEFKGSFMFVWDAIYKKSLLTVDEGIISFDTSFTSGYEDVDLNLRIISRIKKIIVRNQIYYTHFMRAENSTSLKYSKAKLDGLFKTVERTDRLCFDFYKPKAQIEDDEFTLEGLGEKIYQCLRLLSSKDCTLTNKEKKEYFKKFYQLKSMQLTFQKQRSKRPNKRTGLGFSCIYFLRKKLMG